MNLPSYRGRFAPSPTGPLHFGSLVAAVASYADARHHDGQWLVRIEDVDETRAKTGAEAQILATLDAFGMQPDEQPIRQSERSERYDRALEFLRRKRLAYPCNCSRKAIASLARLGREGPIYPGTCRHNPPPTGDPVAWRVALDHATITFTDRVAGYITQQLADEIGDFIVRRVDGFTAYQLTVVVDDHEQAITHVVRGADLLWSTPRQIWLQQKLGYTTPHYAHVPLVYGADGSKLSKRDAAHPVDPGDPLPALLSAWLHLGQTSPPGGLRNCNDFWRWACENWTIERVPQDRSSADD